MKSIFLLLASSLFLLTACQDAAPTATDTPQTFGATITADNAISFGELLIKMNQQDSINTKVVGTVESVCQAKGCWVNIINQDKNNPQEMFVKFKDYGFFLPKDIAGRQVVLDGQAYREITPVDELRHYAEDEGKSEEEIAAITKPKEELKFMASGALILPEEQN